MRLFTLPNFLTLGNLFCGILSVLYLTGVLKTEEINVAHSVFYLLCASLILDLLDGMVARALKISSEIGVQLDSLADMVSFGLVPGLIMMNLLNTSLQTEFGIGSVFGFLITLFSALRLAKFNVDTEQSAYFKGLATPANTIFIFSLFWITTKNEGILISKGSVDFFLLLFVTALSSYLLIANLPMFSFKLKGLSWTENYYKYIFLIISFVLLLILGISALAVVIPFYILLSLIFRKKILYA
ncbi:MAG: CDP-alcohol phosphatidyltransferase family protein [Weeksellaceae bacterium]|jgi:CDP-diacylglycerol--serine O-phosphatidyltransferase|nr:CDP-alcohol phosphatidyltransferase family protein [Weeksellaceae bacterium]